MITENQVKRSNIQMDIQSKNNRLLKIEKEMSDLRFLKKKYKKQLKKLNKQLEETK